MHNRLSRFWKRNAVNLTIVLVVAALYAATMIPGVRTVFYQEENKPVYQGPDVPYAAIECNVYEGGEYLPEILKILAERNVHITFNIGGLFADSDPASVAMLASAGHELGNHGYRHLDQGSLSYDDNCREIRRCHEAVVRAAGVRMTIFAPPSGDYGDATVKAARDLGYTTVMWSADTIDWRDQDADLLVRRTEEKIAPGGILLIHPTKATVEALPAILDVMEEKGLSVVPVGELLSMEPGAA